MKLTIRSLSDAEIRSLVEAAARHQLEYANRIPGLGSESGVRRSFEGWIPSAGVDLFFGCESAGELVAKLWLQRQGESLGRPLLLVSMIEVKQSARGRGIAKEFAHQVILGLEMEPPPILRAYVYADNGASLAAAKSLGAEPIMHLLALDVRALAGRLDD